MTLRIFIDRDAIAGFCRRWRISELSFFGSITRDDFRPDSDVDVLVTFEKDADWSLFDHVRMERELAEILGRKVDLLTRRAVERSTNWLRRKKIMEGAESFYVAG